MKFKLANFKAVFWIQIWINIGSVFSSLRDPDLGSIFLMQIPDPDLVIVRVLPVLFDVLLVLLDVFLVLASILVCLILLLIQQQGIAVLKSQERLQVKILCRLIIIRNKNLGSGFLDLDSRIRIQTPDSGIQIPRSRFRDPDFGSGSGFWDPDMGSILKQNPGSVPVFNKCHIQIQNTALRILKSIFFGYPYL
ncbi:MAG: hypothetical protein FJ333_02040 [Sphingomonadales bacterium]|nr:hypothetical protein [Sphingomonadales bacterium]